MSADQLSLALDKPAHGGCAAMPGSAYSWVESWHNFDLCFGKLSPEHQRAQLDETAKWLFTGRRWPLNPSDRQHEHAVHWFPRVRIIMARHEWDITWKEDKVFGYVVKWTWRRDPSHHLHGCGPSAPYAGITSAAICRRKARYYGIWGTPDIWQNS